MQIHRADCCQDSYKNFFLLLNGYLMETSWQPYHFTTAPKDFQENIPVSVGGLWLFYCCFVVGLGGAVVVFLFLCHLCVDHMATSLSKKSKVRCLWTSSSTVIANQLLFPFPSYSNPLATQVSLGQHIVQQKKLL